jgi:DNA-binding beta-propeller fold protein YncE
MPPWLVMRVSVSWQQAAPLVEESRVIAMPGVKSASNGMAVSRDGAILLVTDADGGSHAIHEFRVADGSRLRVIGAEGDGRLQFKNPRQVWVASDDHVFVAEYGNNRVQVLTPRLDFHAFVGVGQLDRPAGVCADDDVIVVSDGDARPISVFNRGDSALLRRFGSRGSGDGQLDSPHALCFMSGHRHVAVVDARNERVSVFTVKGEFVRHVGVGELLTPAGIACSVSNELVVADWYGCRVAVFSVSGELLRMIGGGFFTGVAIHGGTVFAQAQANGSMYSKCFNVSLLWGQAHVCLSNDFRGEESGVIAMHGVTTSGVAVSHDGSTLLVSVLKGGSHARAILGFRVADGSLAWTMGQLTEVDRLPLQFCRPAQLWVASDDFVFVADAGNNRVQVLTPRLGFHSFVGAGQLSDPAGVCADDDVVVVSEGGAHWHRISVFNRSDGALLRRFGSRGSGDGQLDSPGALCFMSEHRHVAVADAGNHRVSVFTVEGKFVRHVGVGELKHPSGVACSAFDELVVADHDNRRVVLFSASNELLKTMGPGNFYGVAIHGGTIFAQDRDNSKCILFK